MSNKKLWRWLLGAVILVILVSPLFYWATGVGQTATGLSSEIRRLPDGSLVTSPKAEAWHSLAMPMRIERLIIYPILLLAFQLSGGAVALREYLEARLYPALSRRFRGLGGFFNKLGGWLWRYRLAGSGLIIIFLFIVTLDLLIFTIYLPFNYYRSFILAHQFGLSTQTAAGWFSDWGKGVMINLVTDGLIWAGFYLLLQLFPRRWPLPGGALLVIFGFTMTLLTPILITPLFYEVQPLEDTNLRSRILSMADRAGLSVDEVYVIDASSKTTQVNAYVTGFGNAQRIVLYDTLLAGYTPDQVEVVLAHELGHWYYRHVFLGLLGLAAAGWIGLFGLRWLLQRIWRPLGLRSPADVAGLPFILALIFIVSTLTLPVEGSFSRYGERQADEFALAASQKPSVFIELFIQLAEQNLSRVDAPAWEKIIFHTHPTTAERVRHAETFQQQLSAQ
jgi:STE24 endopeptidase